jgi:ElaA protein
MEIELKHYQDLTKDEFHDMIALRIEVFVIEQDCPYQDLDGLDKDAYHLLLKENHEIIGTLRILKEGINYPEISIGRVVSSPKHRKRKLGHLMMERAMRFIQKELNSDSVRISAQTHLCAFYEKYGFLRTGNDYLEDGIPHSEMLHNKP